jgi:SHS2 domain-containing protein
MIAMNAGYEEVDHTADVEIRVWAPDLLELMETSVMGMYSLMGISLQHHPSITKILNLPCSDPEATLVNFLSEVIFFYETEKIGFNGFDFDLKDDILCVKLTGFPILTCRREIKAVTFHKMKINQEKSGLSVHIVFDV